MRFGGFVRPFQRLQRKDDSDLGLGNQISTTGDRIINQDGSFNVERSGYFYWTPYQSLVEMPWPQFFVLVVGFYVSVNAFFASLFVFAGVDNVEGIQPLGLYEDFANAFFFSIQTFTTVGYGALSPKTATADIIAALVALVGLMSFALATGLVFARFSKPRANIIFSEKAIIAPYDDGYSFQFRIANKRNNKIINVEAKVSMSWIEDIDGKPTRQFRALPLERDRIILFPLNWTIVHPIDKDSPLYDKSLDEIKAMKVEFLILIQGFDETYANIVQKNSSYTGHELEYDVRFAPMYYSKHGRTILELDKISEFVSA